MKILFYIIAAIFLFFTAPIWVPIVGLLGLVTMIGGGAAVVAANHAPEAATPPAHVQSVPATVIGCPCSTGKFTGGDPRDPRNWTSIWSDGSVHTLAERPPNRNDEQLISFAVQARDASADPRVRRLAQNALTAWGINYSVEPRQ